MTSSGTTRPASTSPSCPCCSADHGLVRTGHSRDGRLGTAAAVDNLAMAARTVRVWARVLPVLAVVLVSAAAGTVGVRAEGDGLSLVELTNTARAEVGHAPVGKAADLVDVASQQ